MFSETILIQYFMKARLLIAGIENKAVKVSEHSFAHALADLIQHTHRDCKKNKHAVDLVIILFAQCPR